MTTPANPDLENECSQLCTSCGLCCDGTLFQKVRLRPEEIESAKKIGLNVIQDKGFTQPCVKYENACCQIYDSRPKACQTFRCRLLARHIAEGGPIEARLRVVRRVRGALKQLDAYGAQRLPNGDISFSAEGPDAFVAMNTVQELMQILEEDFTRDPSSDDRQIP